MSVEVLVFPEHDLRWVRFSGVLEFADLREIKARVYGVGVGPMGNRSFVDMQDVSDFAIGFLNLLSTSEAAMRSVQAKGTQLRIACHAPSELTFGIARIYHTLLSDTEGVEAFMSRDRAAVLQWLGLESIPPG